MLICPFLETLPSGDKQATLAMRPGWRLESFSIGGNVSYVSTDLKNDADGQQHLKKAYVHAGVWYPLNMSLKNKLVFTLATSADVSLFCVVTQEKAGETGGGCSWA